MSKQKSSKTVRITVRILAAFGGVFLLAMCAAGVSGGIDRAANGDFNVETERRICEYAIHADVARTMHDPESLEMVSWGLHPNSKTYRALIRGKNRFNATVTNEVDGKMPSACETTLRNMLARN